MPVSKSTTRNSTRLPTSWVSNRGDYEKKKKASLNIIDSAARRQDWVLYHLHSIEDILTYWSDQPIEKFTITYTPSAEISLDLQMPRGEMSSQYIGTKLREKEWAELVPLLDDIVSDLESHKLNPLITTFIKATIDLEDVKNDVFLYDVLQTIGIHLRDTKILFDIGMERDAILRATRCKELLEFAAMVAETAKAEGLPTLQASQLRKIDQVGGNPVYKSS